MEKLAAKKILSLVLILSLTMGWIYPAICEAQEAEQPIEEATAKQENSATTAIDVSQEKDPSTNVLEEYVIPIALIPAIPIFLALQIGCNLVYGVYGMFEEGVRNPCVPR